ncbi:MAG: arginyl-tRNA synthetase, partial [Parcubacteria group bacterium Greene0416_79]
MIVEEFTQAIVKAVQTFGIDTPEVTLEHPADFAHGDYSTNVALRYAKELKMKPRELAEKILERLNLSADLRLSLEKTEIAGAGFINFHLTSQFFQEQVAEIHKIGNSFGKNSTRNGQRIFFEHTQPNPFKEFHIGHLMNNAIGESVSRILAWSGAEVTRATYHGDVGLHVAKAVWGMRQKEPHDTRYTIHDIGEAYKAGSEAYETDGAVKEEIIAINRKIYERSDPKINALYEAGKKISLALFEALYERLGITFYFHFFESEAGDIGIRIVEENIGKIFEQSNQAVVYRGEKHGLHTRVFLTAEGLPTYEAKEVGLARQKKEAAQFDSAITVTANEQNDFFRVVEKAIGEVFPKYTGKMRHLSHGMLRLPSGKMSSRTGTVISAESLIAQVKELVQQKIKQRDMTSEEKEKLAEIVAIGAIKYSILRQAIGGDIIFDFEKSVSFEGDSGPYLQYSYVRAKSVLEKATSREVQPQVGKEVEPRREVTILERLLYRFPEVVARAGEELEPHYVMTYLTELAGAFNSWYANNQIIGSGALEPYRLALTQAFATVMRNGLFLLGISVP